MILVYYTLTFRMLVIFATLEKLGKFVSDELLLLIHLFNGLFSRTVWVSWYHKGKTSLDLNEARDDGVLGYSGNQLDLYKQSAPLCRQITTLNKYVRMHNLQPRHFSCSHFALAFSSFSLYFNTESSE